LSEAITLRVAESNLDKVWSAQIKALNVMVNGEFAIKRFLIETKARV
jgi:hypothetical protein